MPQGEPLTDDQIDDLVRRFLDAVDDGDPT
jgi:hypothetical protein